MHVFEFGLRCGEENPRGLFPGVYFLPPPNAEMGRSRPASFRTPCGRSGGPRAGERPPHFDPPTTLSNEHYHLDVAYSATTRLAVRRSGSAAPARQVTPFGQRIQDIRYNYMHFGEMRSQRKAEWSAQGALQQPSPPSCHALCLLLPICN